MDHRERRDRGLAYIADEAVYEEMKKMPQAFAKAQQYGLDGL